MQILIILFVRKENIEMQITEPSNFNPPIEDISFLIKECHSDFQPQKIHRMVSQSAASHHRHITCRFRNQTRSCYRQNSSVTIEINKKERKKKRAIFNSIIVVRLLSDGSGAIGFFSFFHNRRWKLRG